MKPLPERARAFATHAHRRIGHRRKYHGKPYEVHLKEVARLVAGVADDPEMVAAAWLHDVIEDTPATLEEVEAEFGHGVAELVEQLTDVTRPGDGARAARKALDRAHLAEASPRAKTIKLADLIDNARDITAHDPAFAQVFIPEMVELLAGLGVGAAPLVLQATGTAAKCAAELGIAAAPAAAELPSETPVPEWLAGTERELRTLRRVAQFFGAAQLARPLAWFDRGDDPARVAQAMAARALEVAGIVADGEPVGYVARTVRGGAAELARVRRFAPGQVVADEASFADVIQVLTRYRWCFVAPYERVAAVIARADLQRPLVRMWLFGLLTALELGLNRQLESTWPDDAWAARLPGERLAKARALHAERARRGHPARLIDCLQLGDKAQLAIEHPALFRTLGAATKSEARKAFAEVQSLRNNLAHAQEFAEQDWPVIVRLNLRVAELLRRSDTG